MEAQDLQSAIDTIKNSSAYAYGDPLTFKTPLKRYEAELPAPCDPYDYLRLLESKFGVSIPREGRVAVVGAGYGGLCGLALLEGAKEAMAIEPRFRFKDGLDLVHGLIAKVHGEKMRTYYAWPHESTRESVGEFDLILWPEGTEEMPEPIKIFKYVLGLIAPGGKLVVEFRTGDNSAIPSGRINSWLPTNEALASMLDAIEAPNPAAPIPGRMQNRVIFAVTKSLGVKVDQKPVKAAPVKETPKSAPKPEPKLPPKTAPTKPKAPIDPKPETDTPEIEG